MRIEPGVGWGEAKLGVTMRELVAAFGQPTRTEDEGDVRVESWETQGLRVSIDKATKKVARVEVFGHDPDEPGFGRKAELEGSELQFGMTEDEVLDVLGEPRLVHRGDDWAELQFANGLRVQVVNDAVVRVTVAPASANAEREVRNPELEAAIAAQPEERGPWLVFGDWLSQQGHARGELVAAQANGADVSTRPADELLGAVAAFDDMIVDRTWRLGFLEKARLASNFERSPIHDGEREHVALHDVLALFFDSLAGRFVRDLTLGISDFESNDYGAEMAVIAARPRPLLRSLFIGDFAREETELNWSHLGDAGAMWAALPNLREVTLRSGSMTLGEISLPQLRSFTTLTGGLRKTELFAIAHASWPKLERLSLQIGADRYGCDVELSDFAPLLDGRVPKSVRHLGLSNTEHADALVPLLAQSPVLTQLEELDLSRGTLGPEGAEALLAMRGRFQHLKRLDLSESWLPPELVKKVREGLPQAVLDEQQYDPRYPDDRYIAAGE